MEFSFAIAVTAAAVGSLVGLTGVGAGALMTPLLIVGFGVSPAVAVATDLLYASVTKVAGGLTHIRHGGVQWLVLRRLWVGGLLGVGVGVLALFLLLEIQVESDVLRILLASAISVAAVSMLVRSLGLRSPRQSKSRDSGSSASVLTFSGGAGIGLAVSLTSVGAGALGMALLTRVSPRDTPPRALVGTDLLFAVPIALVAGMSYLFGGLVDLQLLVNLLAGSIPGVVVGGALAGKVPSRLLSLAIACALIAAAFIVARSVFAS